VRPVTTSITTQAACADVTSRETYGAIRQEDLMDVHRSDLEKIYDIVKIAYEHHLARDEMNAKLHLATAARLSPLTSELGATVDRLKHLLA
jgi:hypothetical protein